MRDGIARQLSTIAAIDRLVAMDKGRIIEESSHEALLKAGGLSCGEHQLFGLDPWLTNLCSIG